MKKRKNYTKGFKAQVALDAIKGQKAIAVSFFGFIPY